MAVVAVVVVVMVGLGSESVRGNMKHVVVVGGGSGARMGGRGVGGHVSLYSLNAVYHIFPFILFFPFYFIFYFFVGLDLPLFLVWLIFCRSCFSRRKS